MKIVFTDLNKVHGGEAVMIQEALDFQSRLLQDIAGDPRNDHHIFYAEHTPVYTVVKNKTGLLFRSAERPVDVRIPLVEVERAGSITFHGPGQLVYYLVLNMNTLRIRSGTLSQCIDEIVIEALDECNISAHPKPEHLPTEASGVWITENGGKQKKIASRGIVIKKRGETHITQFGFSVNVSVDLQPFDFIYPCGLDIEMTSMKEVLDRAPSLKKVARRINAIIQTKFEQKEKAS